MQGGLVARKESVRLSVKRVNCDKTEERYAQMCIPYERSFSLVFWEEEWLVGATPSTWNFGSTEPPLERIRRYSLVAAQPWYLPKKSLINITRKSTTRFPVSLRWSLYVDPKGSRTQNGRFPSKIALCLEKVCYRVSLCENRLQQCCKAFIGLTICAKMINGGRPLLP